MATIKSYTDINQSRKLAEILPLESADMIYTPIMDIDSMSSSGFLDIPECYPFNEFKNNTIKPLPCWSLTSLLDILPKEYTNSKNQVCSLHIDIVDSETPYLMWYANPEHEGSIVEIKTKEYYNLINACYEMILKLHELDLV